MVRRLGFFLRFCFCLAEGLGFCLGAEATRLLGLRFLPARDCVPAGALEVSVLLGVVVVVVFGRGLVTGAVGCSARGLAGAAGWLLDDSDGDMVGRGLVTDGGSMLYSSEHHRRDQSTSPVARWPVSTLR